jgi:hypothetical protein
MIAVARAAGEPDTRGPKDSVRIARIRRTAPIGARFRLIG